MPNFLKHHTLSLTKDTIVKGSSCQNLKAALKKRKRQNLMPKVLCNITFTSNSVAAHVYYVVSNGLARAWAFESEDLAA